MIVGNSARITSQRRSGESSRFHRDALACEPWRFRVEIKIRVGTALMAIPATAVPAALPKLDAQAYPVLPMAYWIGGQSLM